MSIWSSWTEVGYDLLWSKRPKKVRGQVRAYRNGFSNHYPDSTDGPATVGIASIPTWCVPGRDEEDYDKAGPWLRLSVDSPYAMTWWTRDGDQPTPEPVHACVVMDEAAVRALRDDLEAWLAMPKVRPRRKAACPDDIDPGRRLLATAREAAQRASRSLPADAWDDPPHPATLDSSSYLLEP